MTVTLENGVPCLRKSDGSLFASGLSAQVEYKGCYKNSLSLGCSGKWSLSDGVAVCENVQFEFRPKGEGLLLRTVFKNTAENLPSVDTFRALCLTMADCPCKALITRPRNVNGLSCGTMQSAVETLPLLWGFRGISAEFSAFQLNSEWGILGFVTFCEYFSTVEISGDGVFSALQQVEGKTLKKDDCLSSDWIYISPFPSAAETMAAYGEVIAELSGTGASRFPSPVGFCSWYYYLDRITERDISENAEWFSCHRAEIPAVYIQIDAGWYEKWGDWEPNPDFCRDMAGLACSIRKKGFIPGLWFCPFGAQKDSEIFRAHPEFFVKNATGAPKELPGGKYCFDFSRQDSVEYVQTVVRRFVTQWGYGYLKLDLISDVLTSGVYSDPDFNALKNYRQGMKAVREAAGEDVFLLGCTTPILPSVGLTDGMRTSGDIYDHWECLPRIFARVFKRWWMGNTLFITDADCLLLRTASEEDAACRRPCSRTPEEIKTFVTAMVASGGALMFSDKMPLLKESQLHLLSVCFPQNTFPAVPLDIADCDRPGILDFGMRNGIRTVAVINWENRSREFTVPETMGQLVYEFWSGEFRGLCHSDLKESVEPHGCRVFHIAVSSEFTLVGTDSSLLADIAVENGVYRKNKPDETLIFARRTKNGYTVYRK